LVESFETTEFVGLIRLIHALWFAIAKTGILDALRVSTLELVLLTSATLVVVVPEVFETALVESFVRLVFALSFAVTDSFFLDTITVGTRQLSVWVTSTDLAVIEWELLEAALRVVLIRTIWAVLVTVTVGAFHNTVSRDTLEHSWWAESNIMIGFSVDLGLEKIQVLAGEWHLLRTTDLE
jgi:hypothetical protein